MAKKHLVTFIFTIGFRSVSPLPHSTFGQGGSATSESQTGNFPALGPFFNPFLSEGRVPVPPRTSHPSSAAPSRTPSTSPSTSPSTRTPSSSPSTSPSRNPSSSPTTSPSRNPSTSPSTSRPSQNPSSPPSFLPSWNPSSSPTSQPISTSPPVPNPTEHPTKSPTPRPSANPTEPPTKKPSGSPSREPTGRPTNSPSTAPSPAPTSSPTPIPTNSPSTAPSPAPTTSPTQDSRVGGQGPGLDNGKRTMTSSHQFQWGSHTEGCTYHTPDALLSCEGGGYIYIVSEENCRCDYLNVDTLRCSAIDSAVDSILDFMCAGVKLNHLTARGEVIPSEGENCNAFMRETIADGVATTTRGGNVVVFAGMGRYCRVQGGDVRIENVYPCSTGHGASDDDGAIYCAAGDMCSEDRVCQGQICNGLRSCDTPAEGLIVLDPDDRAECIFRDTHLDLSNAFFEPSLLTSFHYSEWTYSGGGLGCQGWEVPSATFTCSNGGEIYQEQKYRFCNYEDIDTITCTPPSMGPGEARVSHFMTFWCLGESASQLDLIAEVGESTSAANCGRNGLAIQGLWLSRACGEMGTDDFQFLTLPSFCDNPAQFFEPGQRMNPLCIAGDLCETGSSCSRIDLPGVKVTSSEIDLGLGTCIYAYNY